MKHTCFLIVFLIIAVSPSLAEDPPVGKLPDGRPYRTDSDGNMVIDYIAELEQQVDTLQRQVSGLEAQLFQKSEELTAARNGAPSLTERTIIGSTGEMNARTDCPSIDELSKKVVARYEDTIHTYTEQLLERDAEIERLRKEQIDPVSQNSNALLEKRRNEVAQLEKKVASIYQENLALKNDLTRTSKELEQFKQQLASTNAQLRALTADPKHRITTNQSFARNLPRASLNISSLQTTKSIAVDVLRIELQNRMKKLSLDAQARDVLYARYSKEPRVVQFSPAPLIGFDGSSLEQLKNEVKNASSAKELSKINSSLASIENRVADDIGIMKRVGKL